MNITDFYIQFGGKLHRVTCAAFEPEASKPFAEFEGHWNADYHWTIEKEGPNEFVDTRKTKLKEKKVKAIHLQEPTESRRMWREVTEEGFTNHTLRFFFSYYKYSCKPM